MRTSSWLAALPPLLALASAVHFDVNVGKGGQLKFDPDSLTAAVGDSVTYHFFSKVSGRPRGERESSALWLTCCASRTTRWCSRPSTVRHNTPTDRQDGKDRRELEMADGRADRSLPYPPGRLLLGLHSHSVGHERLGHDLHHPAQRHEAHLGVLRPGHPLQERHGARHQCVSSAASRKRQLTDR